MDFLYRLLSDQESVEDKPEGSDSEVGRLKPTGILLSESELLKLGRKPRPQRKVAVTVKRGNTLYCQYNTSEGNSGGVRPPAGLGGAGRGLGGQ